VLETNASHLDQDLQGVFGMEFSNHPNPMWVFDQLTLAFVAVNDAALRVYGYSREEFLAMTTLDIRPPEDIPQVLRNALRPHTVSGKHEHWRHCTKTGEILEVEISGVSLVFENRRAQIVTVFRCPGAAAAH
jgi:two-component system cell cycle sensor histidine kinase/response regulator CckA